MTGSAWARRATPEIIRAGTQLRSVPLVPDIRLHQASDPISLWQRTELTSGRTGLDPMLLFLVKAFFSVIWNLTSVGFAEGWTRQGWAAPGRRAGSY